MSSFNKFVVTIGILIAIVIIMAMNCLEIVPAGNVGVGTMFGKVQNTVYNEGLNVVNPFVEIKLFDARQKTYKESVSVPSQDQLSTDFEFSIQYRLIQSMAPNMYRETGTPEEVIDVHLTPLSRSLTREVGKSVKNAEDFFDQEVQRRLQTELLTGFATLSTKGIKIEKVLIRDMRLPKLITKAVELKKLATQAADRAVEELRKFKVDQDKKKTLATAEKEAAIIEASKKAEVALTIANGNLAAARVNALATVVKAAAEAEAKRKNIDVIGRAGFIQLETAKVLPELANGNHIIMMDPEGNMLPFMDLNKLR